MLLRFKAFSFILPCLFCFHTYAKQPPNIIFIIGDDISQEDIGCYGNTSIKTPNINKLSKRGIQFNNAFVTSSSCSPSRSSIITGRYPHNTGAAELHTSVPEHLIFFPELLRKAGYYTAQAGKWHEGANTRRAYDILIASTEKNGPGGEALWVSLLEERPKDKPFFFWLASFDAHRLWDDEIDKNARHHPDSVWVPPTLLDNEETRKDIAAYYDEIGRLDHHIGLLVATLEKQHILENTVIVFISDNARAFPGNKTRLYDRGIKTPLIVQWPATIKANTICNSLVSSIDIAPTLLEIAGVKATKSIQGKSFVRLFEKPDQAFRTYIFAEHNWHDFEAFERAVRSKDYLYIKNARASLSNAGAIDVDQSPSAQALKKSALTLNPLQNDPYLVPRAPEELYDLRHDLNQAKNLAGDPVHAAALASLRLILLKWQEHTADTQPAELTHDWYDRNNAEKLPDYGKRGEMPGSRRRASFVNHRGIF